MSVRLSVLKILSRGAAALFVASFLATTANAQDKTVRWKMQSWFPSGTPHAGKTGKDIEIKINRVSGGTFRIQFFEPKALIPPPECFEAVKRGSVDACWSTPGYWYGQEPTFALFSSAPFGMDWPGLMAWFYQHGGRQIYEKLYNKYNMHAMPCGGMIPEASGWFKKEIKSIDEFKGLKMRFLPLGSLVMDKLGVSTQLLAGGDVLPALQLGTIDAAEFAAPSVDRGLGLHQAAKYYYFPGWHQPATLYDIMINLDRWKALSESQKAMLEMVCGDNIRQAIAEGESMQPDVLADFESKGVQIRRWPPDILKAIEKAWREVAAELSAKDATFKEAYESMQAWEKKYQRWLKLGYLER